MRKTQRNRTLSACLLAALLLCALLGCGRAATPPAEATRTLTDMAGRTVAVKEAPQRIVALTAGDVEILYALGAGTQLIGRGEYCDYPAEALSVQAVQSGSETNVEQIIALSPDVVVMGMMDQTTEQTQKIEAAGVPVAVTNAQDVAGVCEAIAFLGALSGHTAEAEALTADMQAAFTAVETASTASGKTVYFEVSPLEYGLWTSGSGTFMDELATMCGLTNVFSDVSGWAEVSEEQVIERAPDYIVTITMYYGEGPTPAQEIAARPGWGELPAVQSGRILCLDSNAASRPGPRLVEAAQALAAFVKES